LSSISLNREELLQDSLSTLRKVAGVLDDLWDLHPFEANGSECHGMGGLCSNRGADIARVLKDTHREVQALQEGIGALHELLPPSKTQGGPGRSPDPGLETTKGRRAARASEVLTEVQTRLDRLAQDIGQQGMGMK